MLGYHFVFEKFHGPQNKKFGSGARDKKMAKLNSSDSAHDMSNFNWKKNKQVPKGMERKGKAGKAGKGKASRPGKSTGAL